MNFDIKNWGFSRVFRVIVGLGVLIYGSIYVDWALIMFGIVIAYMGIANMGCGPFSSNCDVDPNQRNEETPRQIKIERRN